MSGRRMSPTVTSVGKPTDTTFANMIDSRQFAGVCSTGQLRKTISVPLNWSRSTLVAGNESGHAYWKKFLTWIKCKVGRKRLFIDTGKSMLENSTRWCAFKKAEDWLGENKQTKIKQGINLILTGDIGVQ